VLNESHRDHKRKDTPESNGSITYIKHVAREILEFPVPSFIFTWSLIIYPILSICPCVLSTYRVVNSKKCAYFLVSIHKRKSFS